LVIFRDFISPTLTFFLALQLQVAASIRVYYSKSFNYQFP
jgi:hypothetical protein